MTCHIKCPAHTNHFSVNTLINTNKDQIPKLKSGLCRLKPGFYVINEVEARKN
jgi:hypothetical protein